MPAAAGQMMSAVDRQGPFTEAGQKPVPHAWLTYLFGKSKGRGFRLEGICPTPSLKLQRTSTGDSLGLGYSSAPEAGEEPTKFEKHSSRRHRSAGRHSKDESAGGGSPTSCEDGDGKGKLSKQDEVRKHTKPRSAAAAVRLTRSDSAEALGIPEKGIKGSQEYEVTGEDGELVPPKDLVPTGRLPELNNPSTLLKEEHLKGLMAAVPKRLRQANWTLLYGTAIHGFSLKSLFRRAANFAPSILIIKDAAEHIFGAYCSEAWKVAPRFYGTGESFVFELEPRRLYYPWKRKHKSRNDYFMYGSQDSIGIGGSGHFALWLDGDLLYGHSGVSDTFGSPCLASKSEFKILSLELWALS